MTNFETNKKHASDAWELVPQKIIRIMLAVVCLSLGYTFGLSSVRKEAVEKGYAEFDKDGFHWKSRRAIEQGGKG